MWLKRGRLKGLGSKIKVWTWSKNESYEFIGII